MNCRSIALLAFLPILSHGQDTLHFSDPKPQRYLLKARASQIDPLAKPHPEIEFVFEKKGKPADEENAAVDTRVAPQGKLVIWLMGNSSGLFERLNSYGLHAIQVHYANGWFGKFGKEPLLLMINSWARFVSKPPPVRTLAMWSAFPSLMA